MMTCMKHPRYAAKRKPRIDCIGCWEAYYYNPANDGATFSAEDMSSIMYAVEIDRDKRNEDMQDLVEAIREKVRKL